jgi:hypothetical protein
MARKRDEFLTQQLQQQGFGQEFIEGFCCYLDNTPVTDPSSTERMQGWVAGWGWQDNREGGSPIFPNDPDYMNGYGTMSKNIQIQEA